MEECWFSHSETLDTVWENIQYDVHTLDTLRSDTWLDFLADWDIYRALWSDFKDEQTDLSVGHVSWNIFSYVADHLVSNTVWKKQNMDGK